jgi:glutathione S-transferase
MADSTSLPRLLHFRISHYNEKVRWTLDYKRCPHVREALVPGFHLARTRALTSQNKTPILVLDGIPTFGSADILDELERRCPDPPLYPVDPMDRKRALTIERYFDDTVAPDLRRLFWSTYLGHPALCARMATDGFSSGVRAIWRAGFPIMKPLFKRNLGIDEGSLGRARANLGHYFDRLESEIGSSGYLVGDAFGLADLAAAAVMTAIIRPPQFSYPLPEPWPNELVDLRGSVSERTGFRWVLDIYARHRGASFESRKAA